MMKKVLLLFLLFAAVKTLPVQEDDTAKNSTEEVEIDYRLPNDIIPIHYNIKLVPHIVEENFTFDGEMSAKIKIKNPVDTIKLHSAKLIIDESATVLKPESGEPMFPKEHNHDNVTDILSLHFLDTLTPGLYTLYMKYIGSISDDLYGFYRSSYENDDGETVWLASTQFEATYARRAFPCWDEPALKATFNISIKHYTNYTALSNMPIIAQSPVDESDGKMWTHFDTTPVMSTYLIAFVVADYGNLSNADGTVAVWCRRNALNNARLVLETAAKATTALEEFTKSVFRVPKMDHVAVPTHPSGAMENWGLITYPESAFLYAENSSSTSVKQRIVLVVVHELTHQWFGNVVSPSWWSYIWLNEGFATFFESYIMDKILDNWRQWEQYVVREQQWVLYYDSRYSARASTANVSSPKEIGSSFGTETYFKTASLIRMLYHFITEDVFRNGLVDYLNTHKFSSATPDDLWRALQTALDASDVPHDDFTIKDVMSTWLEQRRSPVVTVYRDDATGETKLRQEAQVYRQQNKTDCDDLEDCEDPSINNTWWIPITYTTKSDLDFSNTLPKAWLKPDNQSISIGHVDDDDWIIVNIQQTGFYRVNYDEENWKKIAQYLNSDNYTNIHVLNRAQIIEDAHRLTEVRRISPILFFDIVNYLSRETDYIAWFPAFRLLNEVESYLLNTAETDKIKLYVLTLMTSVIDKVGFEERPDDDHSTKLLRTNVFKWACTLGHPECENIATACMTKYLEDPDNNRIPPDLRATMVCTGMKKTNETLWKRALDLYITKKVPHALRFVACAENLTIIEELLNMTIAEDSPIKKHDTYDIYCDMLERNPTAFPLLIDFIANNSEAIYARVREPMAVFHELVYNIWKTKDLEQMKAHRAMHKFDTIQEASWKKLITLAENRLSTANQVINLLNEYLKLKELTNLLKQINI